MSDAMSRFKQKFGGGMGGGMGGGAEQNPTAQAVEANRSMFNPDDLAAAATQGQITPDMTIREFIESNGMDVEGPVTQLVEWQMSQLDKANPVNKMKAIANAGQPGGGANMPMQGQPPGAGSRLPQGRKPAVGAGIGGLKAAMTGGA